MKITKYRLFWVWEHEREEDWLNAMSQQGWQLSSVGFCRYTFEEGEAGAYQYHLELLEGLPTAPQSKAYLGFMEDMGVEHVGSLFGWVYFRKKASESDFHLYSDTASPLKHFGRMYHLVLVALGINLFAGLLNLAAYLRGSTFNGKMSLLSFVVSAQLLYAWGKLGQKVKALKRDHLLNE